MRSGDVPITPSKRTRAIISYSSSNRMAFTYRNESLCHAVPLDAIAISYLEPVKHTVLSTLA